MELRVRASRRGIMKGNRRLAALRNMLHAMEREVGLQELSTIQRDIYYAACLSRDDQSLLSTDALRTHPIVRELPRSSFFRALKDLVDLGYFKPAGSPRSGLYEVVK
jgi:hypothetical protein